VVLTEAHTDGMDRLMSGLRDMHKQVGNTCIPHGCAGRRGFGVAVVAANSSADFMTLHVVLQSLQCVWVCCKGSLFLASLKMPCLVLPVSCPRGNPFQVRK